MGLPMVAGRSSASLVGVAPARAGHPPPRRPDLLARDGHHDRPGGGHRLRPLRRHPLPTGPGRGAKATHRPWSSSLSMAGRAVLLAGIDRGHLAARPLRDRPGVHGGEWPRHSIIAVLLVMDGNAHPPARTLLGYSGHAIDRLSSAGGSPHEGHPPAGQGLLVSLEPDGPAPGVAHRTGLGWSSWSPLALPLFSMRLAFTDAGNAPSNLTVRQAYNLLARGSGRDSTGRSIVAVAMDGPSQDVRRWTAWTSDLRTRCRAQAQISPGCFNRDRPRRRSSPLIPSGRPRQPPDPAPCRTRSATEVIPQALHGTTGS